MNAKNLTQQLVALAVLVCLFPILGWTQALPDLQVLTPKNLISIGNPTPSTRELRFSHITWNGGAGPLEIRPAYNATTGLSWAVQRLYTVGLSFVQDVPIALPMIWTPPSDYRFAMSTFGLYSDVNGSIGTLIAPSPKVNFCMTADTLVGGIPNTPPQTAYAPSDCLDPNGILGLSVGWGDQYDYTDPGENIDITSLPDGVYWLRSIADPNHVLQDSNPGNNVTDTQLQITGNTVTVLQQLNPLSTPPTVALTSPINGSSVTGTVTLRATATATLSPVQSVQFLVDGAPVGTATLNAGIYSATWNSTPGSHIITVQATASGSGFIGTAAPVSVIVPTQTGSFVVDQTILVDGISAATTPAFSTSTANELLLAFIGSDGPVASQSQSMNVSGAGLTWTLVVRTNAQAGDAEIWAASAPSSLSNVAVTSTATAAGFHQSLTVLALHGSNGTASVGAHATANAAVGQESVSLTTTANGSWVIGVGSDWDGGVARTLGPNQQLLHQWFDPQIGTFWCQATTGTTPLSNTLVTLNDTAPTTDRFDFSAVEVTVSGGSPTPTPTPSPTPDTTPPVVTLLNPVSGQTVSGSVTVSANATDNVALSASNPVLFFLGTTQLPGTVTANPPSFSIPWDTTRSPNGTYSLSAIGTDSSGNKSTATATNVTVTNPPPTTTCFVVDSTTFAHGRGPVTTPVFHDALPGELLVAFAGSDGPNRGGSQTLTVSGAGVTWTLVKRANAQAGTAEIWTANAPLTAPLNNVTVTAKQSKTGYDVSLYVICVQGTNGIGTSVAASASSGAPTVALKTTAAGSLLYATGNDWDNAVARVAGTNQILDNQWLDTSTGDTYWTQNQTYPPLIPAGSTVILNDTAPTNDRWNFVAVEILAEGD
jgi:Bacterial Ig domain/Lysyl oxidase